MGQFIVLVGGGFVSLHEHRSPAHQAHDAERLAPLQALHTGTVQQRRAPDDAQRRLRHVEIQKILQKNTKTPKKKNKICFFYDQ